MPLFKKLKMGADRPASASAAPPPVGGGGGDLAEGAPPVPDSRLPFANYRELYTMKNFWKTVKRNEKKCAASMLMKFLLSNGSYQGLYPKLSKLDLSDDEKVSSSTAFEKMALAYLSIFDDVVNAIEANPSDCTDACERLKEAGSNHKGRVGDFDSGVFQNMEEPFLSMVSTILEDRYTDKAESLFRKFFQFCLKYIVEGYNS